MKLLYLGFVQNPLLMWPFGKSLVLKSLICVTIYICSVVTQTKQNSCNIEIWCFFPLQKIMGGCDSYKQKWHVHVFRFNCFSISSELWFALRNSCAITIFYNPHLMLSKKIQYWTKAWNKRLEAPVIEDHIQRGLHYCPSLLTAPSLSCPLHFLTSVCVNTDDQPRIIHCVCEDFVV